MDNAGSVARSPIGRSASSPTAAAPAPAARPASVGNGCGTSCTAEGITFQRSKIWKESSDPLKEQKLARIEWLLEHQCQRTFVFDEFGPLTDQTRSRRPPGTT